MCPDAPHPACSTDRPLLENNPFITIRPIEREDGSTIYKLTIRTHPVVFIIYVHKFTAWHMRTDGLELDAPTVVDIRYTELGSTTTTQVMAYKVPFNVANQLSFEFDQLTTQGFLSSRDKPVEEEEEREDESSESDIGSPPPLEDAQLQPTIFATVTPEEDGVFRITPASRLINPTQATGFTREENGDGSETLTMTFGQDSEGESVFTFPDIQPEDADAIERAYLTRELPEEEGDFSDDEEPPEMIPRPVFAQVVPTGSGSFQITRTNGEVDYINPQVNRIDIRVCEDGTRTVTEFVLNTENSRHPRRTFPNISAADAERIYEVSVE